MQLMGMYADELRDLLKKIKFCRDITVYISRKSILGTGKIAFLCKFMTNESFDVTLKNLSKTDLNIPFLNFGETV